MRVEYPDIQVKLLPYDNDNGRAAEDNPRCWLFSSGRSAKRQGDGHQSDRQGNEAGDGSQAC